MFCISIVLYFLLTELLLFFADNVGDDDDDDDDNDDNDDDDEENNRDVVVVDVRTVGVNFLIWGVGCILLDDDDGVVFKQLTGDRVD